MDSLIVRLLSFLPFFKANWVKLVLIAASLVALVLVFRGLLSSKSEGTIYVLPEVSKPDSVYSKPTRPEQSAQVRWDSLKKLKL
ncbi:hypothetical protein WBJ53_26200 [Spirosoma sp. SC4-14]|uniref:hypothetical protein n=1 Tax=Spirosoma sp. SC4-14 TaxID=3128900 RepID=UPI0030D4D639